MCEHIAPVLNSRSRLYIFTSDLEGGAISKAAVTSSFSCMILHIDIDMYLILNLQDPPTCLVFSFYVIQFCTSALTWLF